MKTTLTILLSLFLLTAFGQKNGDNIILDNAKILFKSTRDLNSEELEQFDYYPIVSLLEKAIQLNPKNAEAHYFLGYAYSRINSKNGKGMTAMNLELLHKSSEQFEKVIQLSPKYSGEIIVLDPYSKIGAEWGSMALSYWYNNKMDSARWAFLEGKKRGGFGDFILEVNKNVLDACSKNAILVVSGDNCSFPLWYLQLVENYRTDVSIVDINLLNSPWYPAFLVQNKSVAFDLPNNVLDTIEYKRWKSKMITIMGFSWEVKPSYYDEYLLRGDRVFLSLLKENKFQRDVYFTTGFPEESRLSLKDFLSSCIVVDKLSPSKEKSIDFEAYKQLISNYLLLSRHLNHNSPDELNMFDNLRYDLFNRVNDYLDRDEKEKAKELMLLADKFAGEKKYPYSSENVKKYAAFLKERM